MDHFFTFSAAAAGYYAITPLLIFATNKIRAAVEPVEIAPEEFPASLGAFFETQARALEQVGFSRTAYLRTRGAVTQNTFRIDNYAVMMLNRATGDSAMVAAIMKVTSAGEIVRTKYVELSTHYPDGRMFDTLNSPTLGAFARVDRKIKTQLPATSDPRLLYALHRFVMARHNVTARPLGYEESKVAAYLAQQYEGSLAAQARCGRFYFSESDSAYRPTLKGAYLMSWGLMWPFTLFRRAAMQRRSRKLLREFHAANPTLPPLPPLPA